MTLLIFSSAVCWLLCIQDSAAESGPMPFRRDSPVFSSDVLLDTWEPQVLSLSNGDVMIFALNQYGVRACLDCGADPIIYRKTSNNGESWNLIGDSNLTWNYISRSPLTWFADIVAVRDNDDNIYITYIGFTSRPPPHPWNILFQRSTDKGSTWSEPVIVSGNISADKNWMSVDPNNPSRLYVTFNSQFPFAVSTSDGGETWSEPVMMDSQDGSYFFAGGSGVRQQSGEVFFAYAATPNYLDDGEEETSYYSYDMGFDDSNSTANYTYARVYSSSDGGATWKKYNISAWKDIQVCPEWAECGSDFMTGSSALSIGTDDAVYYLYNGDDLSTESPETRVMFSSMTLDQSDFSEPVDISDAPQEINVYHGYVMLASGLKNGDVRAAWMDNRTGLWNVYYRESLDGGSTWSTPSLRISWSTYFSAFQSADGFLFPYGDYGSMTVDKNGMSHIVFGEGLGWYQGGTILYATQAAESDDTEMSGDDNGKDELSAQDVLILSTVLALVFGVLVGAAGMLLFRNSIIPASANTRLLSPQQDRKYSENNF